MLTLVLSSLIAAAPAGEAWSVVLRPAIVVGEKDGSLVLDGPEVPEERTVQAQDTPRLAPARAVSSKAPRRSVLRAPRKRR